MINNSSNFNCECEKKINCNINKCPKCREISLRTEDTDQTTYVCSSEIGRKIGAVLLGYENTDQTSSPCNSNICKEVDSKNMVQNETSKLSEKKSVIPQMILLFIELLIPAITVFLISTMLLSMMMSK